MSLPAGTRLGPYEILAPIGAGGMGEVYRARDTRLDRSVAIKVLPEKLSSSPELRERFEREARAISKLSHPHICSLYDVGRDGETEYLVMEYLEGDTLAHRIGFRALSLEQSLRYGTEIAGALGAAHAAGIVHRDLKPGNVMLTATGVKLLDFGLAKAIAPPASNVDLTSAQTHTRDLTTQGTLLGTVPYMAPEQLEGGEVDARTDIFALGSVLYEMATGTKAFAGASQASLIASILRSEPPPVSSIQPMSPPALDRLVRTCLAKAPAERWQSAHDVALQLRSITEQVSLPPTSETGAPARRRAGWLPWAVAAVLAAVAAAALLLRPAAPRSSAALVRFGLAPPENGAFSYRPAGTFIAVSPDGSQIAYVASDAQSGQRIWVRRLSALDARPVSGTEDASALFWSPDSRSIGFFTGLKLKRVDLGGGAAVPICDVPAGIEKSGTWSQSGDILFAGGQSTAIKRVSSSGGEPAEVTRVDASRGEMRMAFPLFLPDGERFLYLVRLKGGTGNLMLAEPGKAHRVLAPMASAVEYCDPGYLVFCREGTLLAQRFDWKAGRLSGQPFSVAEHVRYFLTTFSAAFGLSRTGVLVYQDRDDLSRLAWIDRTGREVGTVGPPGGYRTFSIDPGGGRVFFARTRPEIGTPDIWSVDLERGVETRITSDVGAEMSPLGLRDGKRIVYSAAQGASPQLYLRDLATGNEEPLFPKEGWFQQGQDISPDGGTLAYIERSEKGVFEAWAGPLTGSAKPVLLLRSPFPIRQVRFSPDGRFVAFVSGESGRSEAYVMPYPGPGEKTRVSAAGALLLTWSPDGRELFYVSDDRQLMSVPVRTSPALQVGSPTALFTLKGRWPQQTSADRTGFSMSPDGKRFLVQIPEVVADELPLTVVLDWTAGVAPK